jgi:L-amino acid N-acyltransferase YncA
MATKPKVEFVPYTEGMLAEIRDIYAHWVAHSTATLQNAEPSVDLVRSMLAPPTPRHFSCAILCDGQVAGYALLGTFKPREDSEESAELTVCLREGFTGRGIGPLAFERLEAVAAERGFHSVVAIVSGENSAGIKLCERSGYQKCAHYRQVGRKFGRFLDLLSYQKILGAPSFG